MIKNPFINAFLASAYIMGVVALITYFEDVTKEGTSEFFMMPMAFLSLLVLSVATMGFLFVYRPFELWFDGERKEAVRFFLTMLATFAAITFIFMVTVFYFVA